MIVDEATWCTIESLVCNCWDGAIEKEGAENKLNKNILPKIVTIKRLENPVAYCHYKQQLKRFFEHATAKDYLPITRIGSESEVQTATLHLDLLDATRTPEINEYYLFHSTKPDTVDAIVSQGLDSRLAMPGYFGKGVYMAENVTKTDQYTGSEFGLFW